MASDNITLVSKMISYSFSGNIVYGSDYFERVLNQQRGLTATGSVYCYTEPLSVTMIQGKLIIRRVPTVNLLRNIDGSSHLSIQTDNGELDMGKGKGEDIDYCWLTEPIEFISEVGNTYTVTINYIFKGE